MCIRDSYKAVEVTANYLKGKEVPQLVEIKHIIVNKDNEMCIRDRS